MALDVTKILSKRLGCSKYRYAVWYCARSVWTVCARAHRGNVMFSLTPRTVSSSVRVLAPLLNSLSMKRGDYAVLSNDDLSYFATVLDPGQIVTDKEALEPHNVDWTRSYQGASKLMLRPRTTDQVSSILAYCNDRRLAVCPQGGNTGLVGGGVPVFDEILLSMALMNEVIHLSPISGVVVCEAGCVLETLDSYVGDHGLMVPLDLGARGTCQIGGNVATNAGGLRLLRYGSLHGNVLGLEAVLADGTVVDCLSKLRKDNTGYDVKQLFIGSEGTLGVITKVVMQCPSRPSSVNLAFLGCESFEDVLQTYRGARAKLGEVISAFEVMDQESLKVVQFFYDVRCPIEPVSRFPFYVLMETSGSNQRHNEEKIHDFLEHVLAVGHVKDGGLYTQSSQMQSVWKIRENITSATLKYGYVFKYDVSLPIESLFDIVSLLRQLVGGRAEMVNGFGHIGDCNIHVNVSASRYDRTLHSLLEPFVFEWVAGHGGSISAEHGVGLQKRDHIHLCKSSEALRLMRSLKQQFDPKSIMNPYKVVPQAV